MCGYHYIQLSLFRSSPEHLPGGWACAMLAGGLYLTLGVLLSVTDHPAAVFQVLVDLSLLAMIARIGLHLRGKLNRLPQTLAALWGINLVLTLIGWPLLHHLLAAQTEGGPLAASVVWISVALVVWNLAAVSLVLRRSLQISTFVAAFVSLHYFLLFEWLTLVLVPGA